MSPEFTFRWVTFASFLAPVGKDRCEFAPADIVIGPAVKVVLVTEVGELGDSLEEAIIAVDRVSDREALVPVLCSEEALDSLHVGPRHIVVGDRAIKG